MPSLHIVSRPLLAPAYRARRVTDVTADFLRQEGRRAVILDLDGNLIGYQDRQASPEVVAWVKGLLRGGVRLCILSNPGRQSTLAEVAAQLGLRGFRGSLPKPLPLSFLAARRHLGMEFNQIAVVGDQLLTDILGGNLLGMLTIWTDTLAGQPEGWLTRHLNRGLEGRYLSWLSARGRELPYVPSVPVAERGGDE